MNPDAPEHESAKPPPSRTIAQPVALLDSVLLAQARLGYALAASMARFDADVLNMSRARRAAGTFASTGTLGDVQAFARKTLEQYRDQASVVLDSGLATSVRFSDMDVVRLLDASSSHLMSMYVAVGERVRELAHTTGADSLLDGVQDELLACLVRCEGEIAVIVSRRRAVSTGMAPERLMALMRRAGRRLLRFMRVATARRRT
jgi:hypothetical protein